MKMSLTLCAKNVDEIRAALQTLSMEKFESNCSGTIGEVDFDYDFVSSSDLWSDDRDSSTITPE
jgi:hypothetical protein